MEELAITRIWMAGVVSMMLVFGALALVGYLSARKREKKDGDSP